jgi:hypothetical protein
MTEEREAGTMLLAGSGARVHETAAMKLHHLAFTFAIAIAAPHAIAAPAEAPQKTVPAGSYILATPKPVFVAGQTLEESSVMTMEDGKLTIDTPQGQMAGTVSVTQTKSVRTTAESPEKVKVLIEKNQTVQTASMNGQENDPTTEVKALVGVPVIVTLADGEWTAVREDGAEPAAAEAKELKRIAREVSGETVRKMYGTEPRKPGDKWSVDAAETIFAGDEDTKDSKGKVELTFDKVDEYQGTKCAFLSGTIDLTGTPGDVPDNADAELKMTGKISIVRAIDLQADLSAEMKGTMDMHMGLPNGGTMKMLGPVTLKGEAKVTK